MENLQEKLLLFVNGIVNHLKYIIMVQPKKPVVKKTTSKKINKKSTNPADSYPNKKDKQGNLLIGGGEGTRAPFKTGGKLSKARNGKPVKKALLGSVLGGMGKQMLGGMASQALGGLMGGGNKGGGQAAGGQAPAAQAPMQRRSTDTTPVKTRGMKKGGKVSKAKSGTSLGMKSVKAGFDKNPGVTRADIITAATKKAQNGVKATKDSTAYFSKKVKSFKELAKGEKGNTEISKFNKRFFEIESGKAAGNQLRQDRKGEPGFDANGFPIKKKKAKSGAKMKMGGKMTKCKDGCK
jgi:hypothetical protein